MRPISAVKTAREIAPSICRNLGRLGLLSVCLFALFTMVEDGWAGSAQNVVVTDQLGRDVHIPQPPRRIVTLAPSITEIVFYLGLGDRVVGVTRFSNYPDEANLKPRVGSYTDLNVERIISLAPDLVLGTRDGNQPGSVRLMEQAGLTVFILDTKDLDQVIETIVTVGRLCSISNKAIRMAGDLEHRIERLRQKVQSHPKPRVFFQINPRPIMSINKETFLHDLISLAGGRNIAAEATIKYPRISIEEVIQRKPEVIIVAGMKQGRSLEEARRRWLEFPLIPAVKNGRVHLIDSDLTNRPSPRIVQGLETMARLIHPELKWDD